MATYITEECINCGACEPECPNEAISEGEDIYVIDPKLCTECVGFHDHEACQAVCPVECCLPDPNHREDEKPLLERALKLPTIPDDSSEVIYAKYYLGRARIETRRDIAGGLAMVRAARAEMAPDPWSADIVRELDAWLAASGGTHH